MQKPWTTVRTGFVYLESAEAAAAALKRDLPKQNLETRVIGSASSSYTVQAREREDVFAPRWRVYTADARMGKILS